MNTRILLFIAWSSLTISRLGAQPSTTPVFNGIIFVRNQPHALFKVTEGKSPWKGLPDQKIPGSTWILREIKVRPPTVVVEVDEGKRVSLAHGETYADGKVIQAPPEIVSTPEPKPKLIPVNMPVFPREHHAAPAAPVVTPRPVAAPPYKLNASGPQAATFQSLAVPGAASVVMVTSKACPACRSAAPMMENWAASHGEYRVVFADVGTTRQGGINWEAPVIRTNNIHALPYFVFLDARGNVTARGQQAMSLIDQ